jgi:hypothetical protein
VTLPAGRWINYNDKRTVYDGAKNVTVPAPLGTIPLFVREGAIIPRGDIVKLNNNWEENWKAKLRIEVFPSGKAASEFNYFTGVNAQKIAATPSSEGLTIEFGDLGTPGTLEIYCRGAKEIVTEDGRKLREGRDYNYDATAQKLTVAFQRATKLKLKGAVSLFNP